MNKKMIAFTISLLGLNLACDEKKEITQAFCEAQTTRADCEAAGCTYTCGMVFLKRLPNSSRDCVARRHVARCLAVVKFVGEDDSTNYGDIGYLMRPNTIGWMADYDTRSKVENNENVEYGSMFKIRNPFPYTVEVLGHHLYFWDHLPEDQDPCFEYDPDGALLIPWEGSCETDWWSPSMWDDVLQK